MAHIQSGANLSSLITVNNASNGNATFMLSPCMSARSQDSLSTVVLFGYVLPGMYLAGAVVNVINMKVLFHRTFTAPTYTFLRFIAFAQFSACFSQSMYLLGFIHVNDIYTVRWISAYIVWPVFCWSTSTSLVFTVIFAIERYFYIRRLIPGADVNAGNRRARWICFAVCLLGIIGNLPKILDKEAPSNLPCVIQRWGFINPPWYHLYTVARFCLLNLGSVSFLIIFNALLVVFLCSRSEVLAEMQPQSTLMLAVRRWRATQHRSLTFTLIGATVVTLLGEIPGALLNPISDRFILDSLKVSFATKRALRLGTMFFLLVEYSGNFIAYFLLDYNYKRVLRSMFVGHRRHKNKPIAGSNTFIRKFDITVNFIEQK